MNSKGAKKLLLAATVASAIGVSGSNVLAESASQIEAGAAGTVTYDNASGAYPVVTAVLTTPGSLDGYTYKNYSFLAQDSTGSLDMYYASSAYSAYTPTVGDALLINGTYGPYEGLPEVDPVSAITVESSGNTTTPTVVTIPQVNLTSLNSESLIGSYAGYLVTINDVTLGNAGSVWTTHANVTTTITDGDGNSMVLYDWASSYSVDGALGGTTALSGEVDVTGFVDFYAASSEAEFIPVSITAVPTPEPSTLALCGFGSVMGGLFFRRFRKAAKTV